MNAHGAAPPWTGDGRRLHRNPFAINAITTKAELTV
jgi:hypothetical protein